MNIFGRRWDEKDTVGRQYIKGQLSDGTPCYRHSSIWYACGLCKSSYCHWLCADQAWRTLPPELHKKLLCIHCFMAIRAYLRLKRKSLNKT